MSQSLPLPDGLYQVTTSRFCAGFLVAGGAVRRSDCAPILWRQLTWWATSACCLRLGD